MSKDNEYLGTIEEVVNDARNVDKPAREFNKMAGNSPSFDPERRRFLQYAARVIVGGILSVKGIAAIEGCALHDISAAIQKNMAVYNVDWEKWLMSQDLIRGPPLWIGRNGLPNDWKNHVDNPFNQGWGAVDYLVPIGTPVVPTANAYSLTADDPTLYPNPPPNKNLIMVLLHSLGYNSRYAHLDGFTDVVYEGKRVDRRGFPFMDRSINKLTVVAFSGNTGIGPGGRGPPDPQVHFEIRRYRNDGQERLSLDPFKIGIDAEKPFGGIAQGIPYGGRPVYWDGKTAIYGLKDRPKRLQQSQDTLKKRVMESNLDNATKEEILKRHNNPIELRDYVGYRVLEKKKDQGGKERYEFMPGSLPYELMLEFYSRTSKQEFIAMLPFIFPPLKHVYQKANPK